MTATSSPARLELMRDGQGLYLSDGTMVVRGDLERMLPRLQPGNLPRELLVRAAKVKGGRDAAPVAETAGGPQAHPRRPLAIDATAGLGDDALLLTAAGFEVMLYEGNPSIAALLEDALDRASRVPQLAPLVARMHLHEGDSIEALAQMAAHIDDGAPAPAVVYLDPMFPASRKSAAAKKKFQLLRQLECPEQRQVQLLEAALAVHPRKVVVKRPLKGPYLADRKPAYSLRGKSVRYDCLLGILQ